MVMEDDQVLAERCVRGDTEAFGLLYDRYMAKIYRFIYYKTFVKETAEDITSDVFHKAFERLHSFDSKKGVFSAWLYRIARNTVIDHYRTQKKNIPIDDIFDLATENRTIEEHDALSALAKVEEYLKSLPARQREIITLRLWEELSYREIADIIGGTEDSVKMAFSRAIRDVREHCGPFTLLVLLTITTRITLPFRELS
jgi:RNA polymerase sigma-70 factor (ECF subfamily)